MPWRGRVDRRLTLLLTVVFVAACATADPTSSQGASPGASGASPGAATGSAGPARTAESFRVAPARWSDCGNGFSCATLRVPSDYADTPAGGFNISLIRRRAADQANRIGALLVNPGGPGASGVELVRESVDAFPAGLRDRFDIVGFDPRGVNASSAVRCIDNLDGRAEIDPSPDDAAEIDALVEETRDYVAQCEANNEGLLPYLSTEAVVEDLEQIRIAIGDEPLNYLGFSYGTLIGSLYADRYPDKIRAMALDGAIDPSLDLDAFRSGQAAAFETSLDHFFEDCADHESCFFHEGGRTERAFDRLMAAIDEEAIPTPRARDRRSVGPGLASYAVLGAMYSKDAWPSLAAALALAKEGDGSLMLLIADPFRGRNPNGSYSNASDAYTANTCLDFPASTNVADYTALADRLAREAPHFAKLIAYNDLECAFWPVPAQRDPAPVRAAGSPPIVVVGTTGDPATPYAWSEALVEQLESSVLITREGEGHTAYLGSRCIQDAVDAYLLDLTLPDDGLTCSTD